MARPASLAEAVRRRREDGAFEHHLCEFLDVFYGKDGDREAQSRLVEADPGLCGDAATDAFVGGVAEHLALRWGLEVPSWSRAPSRYLELPMFVPDEPNLRPILLVASPPAFRSRLIFTGPDPLQRARFPYRRGVVGNPVRLRPAHIEDEDAP